MDIKDYPLAYNGKNYVGPNVRDVVYVWTEDGNPCYVGITSQGIRNRLQSHLRGTDKCMFQKKLRSKPDVFRCYIVDQFYLHADADTSYQHLLDLETYYIDLFGTYHHANLVGYNLTMGGQGMTGFVTSEETRGKRSAAQIGIKKGPFSEEHKRNLSIAHMGHKHSEEHKQKVSNALKGRKHTEESIRKMSIAKKGKKRPPFSEDTKRKMSIAKRTKMACRNGSISASIIADSISRFFVF